MADGMRSRRQRDPELVPAGSAGNPVIRGMLERLRVELDGPAGDRLVANLRRLGQLPEAEQARIVEATKALPVTSDVMQLETSPRWRLEGRWRLVPIPRRETLACWLLAHALRRGFALPKLQRADILTAIGELIANDEDIAAALPSDRNYRLTEYDARQCDLAKLRTRRSRLNTRRRKAGYPNL